MHRHSPELAGDVPQRHVDPGQRVTHERPTANVTMSPIELLPQMLDPRRVLTVEQFKQRLTKFLRRRRHKCADLTPASDLRARREFKKHLVLHPMRLHPRDLDARRCVGHLRGRIVLLSDRVIQQREPADRDVLGSSGPS